MRIMGGQFVMGRTIAEALKAAGEAEARGYRFSYDMLGEGARTAADADRYTASYAEAIAAIGRAARGDDVFGRAGMSVKLSALHPRYRYAQRDRVLAELSPRLKELDAIPLREAVAGMQRSEETTTELQLIMRTSYAC